MRLPLFVLVLLLPPAAALARERVEEKAFPTNGTPTLTLATYRGTITVESSDENEVRVKVTASSLLEQDDAASRALARLKLDWQQTGDSITLTAGNAYETGVRFLWQEDERLDLDIVVTVPRACALSLASGSGAVRVGDITGNVSVKTGEGLIFCRHIDGALTAETRSGDIVVSGCQGDVKLTTQGGFIRTGPVRGRATVTTVNGDIDMLCVNGGLVARADAGDITAPFRGAGLRPHRRREHHAEDRSIRECRHRRLLGLGPGAGDARQPAGPADRHPVGRPGPPRAHGAGQCRRHGHRGACERRAREPDGRGAAVQLRGRARDGSHGSDQSFLFPVIFLFLPIDPDREKD